jgi:beta-glucanase (GH16 family)
MTMTAAIRAAALAACLALPAACSGGGDDAAAWELVWSDEFDGPAGGAPDPARWTAEVGGHGWGNQELQHYTDARDNVALDGAGHLAITARRQTHEARAFTSGRLTTRRKFQQAYGRFEARLKLPTGKGLWPAFWMLGADLDSGVRWPDCGEIDIVEGRGAQPWRVSGAVHGPGYSAGNARIAEYVTADRRDLTAEFHVYAVEWDPEEIRFFVDDRRYHSVRPGVLPGGAPWVFDHPFFLILNVAVGGSFGGPPDDTTPFPQALLADHVRAYRRAP